MVARFFSRGLSTNDHRHGITSRGYAESHAIAASMSRQNHEEFVLI